MTLESSVRFMTPFTMCSFVFVLKTMWCTLILLTSFGGLIGSGSLTGPRFIIEPPYQVEFSNSFGASVECSVTGNPVPDITWIYANGSSVTIVEGVRQTTNEGNLIFLPFSQNKYQNELHNAVYKCVASNPIGAIISREVHIHAVLDEPFELQVYDTFATSGNAAALKCVIPQHVRRYIDIIAWVKDNNERIETSFVDGKKYAIIPSGDLFVTQIDVNDDGSAYCCEGNHRLTGQTKMSISSGKLFVKEPKGNISPKMLNTSTIISVEIGDQIALPCVAQGYPSPTLKWFRRNGDSTLTPVSLSGNKKTTALALLIRNVQSEDFGTYVCIAENIMGIKQKEIKLNGIGTPHLSLTPQSIRLKAAGAEELMCKADGSSETTITWFKNGLPLTSFTNQNKLNVNDTGIYQCFARNSRQMIQAMAQVTSNDMGPKISSGFQEKTIQPGSDVIVDCTASGNPIPNLSWYLYDSPLSGSERVIIKEQKQSIDTIVSTLTLNKVKTEDGGLYLCEASNSNGNAIFPARINVEGKLGIRPMASKTIVAGQNFEIVCPYYGYPVNAIKWKKDTTLLPAMFHQLVYRNGTLRITEVKKGMDDGVYSCFVTNSLGQTATGSVSIAVMIPPKIMPFSFQEELLREGMRARLQCVVSEGDSPITIQWFKDNANIRPELGVNIRTLDEFSSILTIASVTPKHNGNYICRATNKAAATSYTAKLNVNVPPKIVPFTFQDEHLLEGMLVRVSCVVSRGDLPLNITWLKDGQVIPANLSVTIQDFDEYSSVMSIDPVTSNHNGLYTCKAANAAGADSFSAPIVVNELPKWVIKPNNTKVPIGSFALLSCESTGFPKPVTTWYKVEGSDPDGERMELKPSNEYDIFENGSLYIRNIQINHAGFYFCLSKNSIGSISAMPQLTVSFSPYLEKNGSNEMVKRGAPVNFECAAHGDKPITFTWFANGQLIALEISESRFSVQRLDAEEKSISQFRIISAERQDSKTFTCVATNSYGVQNATFHLVVLEKPDPPVNLTVIESTNRSVVIGWTASFDGNKPITKYIIQYKIASDDWLSGVKNLTLPGHKLQSAISILKPSIKYNVRVIAANEMGLGHPSGQIEISMAEQAPSGAPLDVTAVATDSNSFKITWKPPHKEMWNGIIRGYYIGYRLVGSSDKYNFRMLEVPEDYTSTLSMPITDLFKFTQYAVVVQAFNDGGNGPMSKEILAITSESVPTKPPQEVRCSVLSSQAIHLTWNPPPANNIHGLLQGYKVIYKPMDERRNIKQTTNSVKTTKMTIQQLEKFTNYSIQVVAMTRRGDGVKSEPIFCRTMEDISEAPTDIKALPSSAQSILVAWKPPMVPNGVIIKYTVYQKQAGNSKTETERKHSVRSNSTCYEVNGLKEDETYQFWVTASTVVGESASSRTVSQLTSNIQKIPKIAGFDGTVVTPQGEDVLLTCRYVGSPVPQQNWITTPGSPFVEISLITTTSIDVQWKIGNTGGSPILGYKLVYKNEHNNWETVDLDSNAASYHLDNLHCGTNYQIYMTASNHLGYGRSSPVINTATKGGVAVPSPKSSLIEEGSTFVSLNLESWLVDKCPIKYFVVEYKAQSKNQWRLFSDDVKPEKRKLVLSDLVPANWYNLRMIAHSSAGTSAAEYSFATLTPEGATIAPEVMSDDAQSVPISFRFELKHVIALTSTVLIIILTCVIIWICFQSSKTKKHRKNKSGRNIHNGSAQSETGSDSTYNGSYGYYPGRSTLNRNNPKNLRRGDLTPYATGHLTDHFRPEELVAFDPCQPMVAFGNTLPGGHSRQSVEGMVQFPSTAGMVNLHGQFEQMPTAPPMSISYGPRGSLGEMQITGTLNRKMVGRSSSPSLPPPPQPDDCSGVINETTFTFPNPPDDAAGDDHVKSVNDKYDAPLDVKGQHSVQ